MKSVFTYLRSIGVINVILLSLYLINPFNMGYLFGYGVVLMVILRSKFLQLNMDFNFFLLLIFSLIYALFYYFDPIHGTQFIVIYGFTAPFFYIFGKLIVKNCTSSNFIFFTLFAIGFLLSLTSLISVFLNYLEGGFIQVGRNLPLFWDGEILNATIMGSYFLLNMCIPAILISNIGQKKLTFYIIAIIIFLISLICVLRLGSRTQLVIFAFTSLFALIKTAPNQSYKKNIVLFFSLSIVVTVILNKVSFDLNADWLTTFSDRIDSSGGDIASGGGRTLRWIKSFEYLFTHPLGWDVKEFGLSHNLWLDVLRVSGIIPFFILIIFTIRCLFQIKKIYSYIKDNISLKILIISYTLAFFMLFMVEPVFDGMYPVFVVFCLFHGIITKYYSNLSQ